MISKASRRYSNALYSLGEERSVLNEMASDFEELLSLTKSNKELSLFFTSPAISKLKKRAVLKELFEGKINQLSYNFLVLLVNRGREALTMDIMNDFLALKKEKEGILDVHITTVVDLNDDEKAALTGKVNGYTGKKCEMDYKIDKSIIGGFVANFGDTVLDASIKRQLEVLRDKFRSGEYSVN